MSTKVSNISFYVKVEGTAHSSHRNPRGVYNVDVVAERTLQHSACAAINVARDAVPFLNENPNCYTLTVFNSEGHEVVIPRLLHTQHEFKGLFRGRSKNHPPHITHE